MSLTQSDLSGNFTQKDKNKKEVEAAKAILETMTEPMFAAKLQIKLKELPTTTFNETDFLRTCIWHPSKSSLRQLCDQ